MTNYTKLRTIPVFESIESFLLLPTITNSFKLGYVATMGNAGLLKLWSLDNGQQMYVQDESLTLKTRSSTSSSSQSSDLDSCILQSVFAPNTHTLILLTVDQSIVFVRVEPSLVEKLCINGKLEDKTEFAKLFSPYKQYIGDHGEILDVKYADRKERLLAVATNSPDLKIYDLHSWDCKLLKGCCYINLINTGV